MRDDERAALDSALSVALGEPVTIHASQRLSAGASRRTWALELHLADGATRSVVLQRELPGGVRAAAGMAGEAELLRAAADQGVPVAPVVASDDGPGGTGDVLGAWIVLDHVDGETIPRRILRDDEFERARGRLVEQCGHALAGIHRIPLDRAAGLMSGDQVDQFRGVLDAFGDPHPAFEIAFRWLGANRPVDAPSDAVVHGDFRMGNLIVDGGGLRAVLDWELAHLGDPAEDLGWFCSRAWRFGSPLEAGGVGTVTDLLEAYRSAGGRSLDVDDVRWWQVLGTLKWGIMCIVQASRHQSGASRSVELAAIGRRVAETEEDVLALIDGPSDLVPSVAVAGDDPLVTGVPRGPHVRPSAAELLDAVSEYLATVRDEVPGRLGYHARVAGNVVDLVGRELDLGPAVATAHRARLDTLGVADDDALAAGLRSGDVDWTNPTVRRAVRASVRDTLAIAHPGYWEVPS